ncbi:G5 domain-containing protein [Frigoribacterium faeni]|uniref:G5 domain-containing protein n=1 Tax=Frigoribacterium faeni TaxID=145483 RepID=UPI001ABA2D5A|nr:G5 domain-containing protein [Frigoribacterium faeni]NIJ04806.1 hypothetical protein [Frigoribacterium faeni]
MNEERRSTATAKLTRGAVAISVSVVLAFSLSACGASSENTAAPAGLAAIEPSAAPTPVISIKREDVTEVLPFDAVTVDDPTRDIGQDAISVTGQDGSKVLTYEVTYTDGVESGRVVVAENVVAAPVQQVTSIGTRQPYVAPAPVAASAVGGCDSNYAGACVPVASDVDCAGGSGNGPAYVQGPVTIVGSDVYDLDRDGDGVACDR